LILVVRGLAVTSIPFESYPLIVIKIVFNSRGPSRDSVPLAARDPAPTLAPAPARGDRVCPIPARVSPTPPVEIFPPTRMDKFRTTWVSGRAM
jgi:hypothetical protein